MNPRPEELRAPRRWLDLEEVHFSIDEAIRMPSPSFHAWHTKCSCVEDADRLRNRFHPFIAVHLDGVVRSEGQRSAAEFDAWCVFGVDDVVNHLTVAATQ